MGPDMVVVGSVGHEDPAQVALAQDHDVIQALPADRADQPFRMAILPGGVRRNRVIPDAHRHKTAPDSMTVAGIAVANEIGRRLVPWEGLGDLPRNPLRRWMIG